MEQRAVTVIAVVFWGTCNSRHPLKLPPVFSPMADVAERMEVGSSTVLHESQGGIGFYRFSG